MKRPVLIGIVVVVVVAGVGVLVALGEDDEYTSRGGLLVDGTPFRLVAELRMTERVMRAQPNFPSARRLAESSIKNDR